MATHTELGLSDHEYALILAGLGREPGPVELAMLSLMWSEHCAYKHSRRLLGRLPTDGPHVLVGPGENAGAVDVGGGLAVAFKVESHNHPSAVEPFQGAATGVGGILRDVFALGARPIALLDSLRFGEIADSARSRYLLERAVAGIGHYGNSIGVPTVGGEIYFEAEYEQNCLINVMAVGLAPHERLTSSAAVGVSNSLVLLGALTGRDGIGGASVLASAELSGGEDAKRPTVQIGDPFAEKKLLECCLELLDLGLLASLQDLGAAGLTSAASEMAAKGGVGIDIDVASVPLRETDMEPFEIMVSESQERMLCVVEPARVAAVLEVCERWEVLATPIGQVTEPAGGVGAFRVLRHGRVVGELPVSLLVDDCPRYDLAPEAPPRGLYPAPARRLDPSASAGETLLALLACANLASRAPVFTQYDPVVGSRTVRRPAEGDSAVLVLDNGAAIAVAIDGNGRRVAVNPRAGAAEAVYECAANLACAGAEPLGLTNCLNFGNPEKPHVAWQLAEAVDGLAGACETLGVPVVGGNVSLYNESPDGPILPTPVVGMVGLLPDPERAGRTGFLQAGDVIALAGRFHPSRDGSEIAKLHGLAPEGELPTKDLGGLAATHALIRDGVRSGVFHSAHDIAEGGIATALAECVLAGGVGAEVTLPDGLDPFGEDLGTAFIVSGPAAQLSGRDGLAVLGTVGRERLVIAGLLELDLSELTAAHVGSLAVALGEGVGPG
ncbi:phosphoribosylformylglycinamidine synthase subunit PurL [Conexibacter sp. DBS9H8]|uniref:phosphoribosylformylglycinamidine synthase subunit PurL n=1 Tax=Conexibacter sp. DBS9H8 TaxID=2937801 RepID=UPI00200FA6FA|nr:phosphoribosylformylglycinamidine synthase subunit PurL [Conexibacter sp. DBS9H8]